MKLVSALLVCLVLVGCAHRPGAGSYFDAGTTFLALNSGDFVEANPLLSWAPAPAATALASIAIKQGVKTGLSASGVDDKLAHRSVETAGMAAGGWNLAAMAGASTGVGLAIALITGMAYLFIGG